MDLSDDVLFDKRLIDRHIRAGLITPEQVEKHLEGLADMAESGEAIQLDSDEKQTGTDEG